MTDTLVIVFESPNGWAANPQTVLFKETIDVPTDNTMVEWDEIVSLSNQYVDKCGLFQIDSITEESANSNGGPDMWNQWNQLEVGQTITDLTDVYTGTSAFFPEAVGLGYQTSCADAPTPVVEDAPPPAVEDFHPTPVVDSPAHELGVVQISPPLPAATPVAATAPEAVAAPQVASGTTTTLPAVEAVTVAYSGSTVAAPLDSPQLPMTGAHGSSIALLVLVAILLISSGVIAVRKTTAKLIK